MTTPHGLLAELEERVKKNEMRLDALEAKRAEPDGLEALESYLETTTYVPPPGPTPLTGPDWAVAELSDSSMPLTSTNTAPSDSQTDAAPVGVQGGPARASRFAGLGRAVEDSRPLAHAAGGDHDRPGQPAAGNVAESQHGPSSGDAPCTESGSFPIGARVEVRGRALGQRIGKLVGWTEGGLAVVNFAAGLNEEFLPDDLEPWGA